MSFYDFYHAIFGNRRGDNNRFPSGTEERRDYLNNARDPPGNDGINNVQDFNIEMTTDLFEIHGFLEKTINELFSATLPDLFAGLGDSPKVPAVNEDIDPRDHYLKPEFNKSRTGDWNVPEYGHKPDINFKIMTDLFEMHHRFEDQVNDFFSATSIPDMYDGFGKGRNNVNTPPNVPAIQEKVNPRDHYLKPEYNQSKAEDKKVLEDGQKQLGVYSWFDFSPSQNSQSSWSSSYRKTITFGDGTVKTEEVIRNADGTEQRTESTTSLDGNNAPQLIYPYPGFSGFLGYSEMPKIRDPKYDFLNPGYENSNKNGEKVDKDLDNEISLAGIENIPNFSNQPKVFPEDGKGISRTVRTIISHNGVSKKEEIIKRADGTEVRKETISSHEANPSGFLGVTGRKMKDILDLFLAK